MGAVGRWIDSLPEDAMRDRIIMHPDPTYDGSVYFWNENLQCGCLVGCVVPEKEHKGKENQLLWWLHTHCPELVRAKGRNEKGVYTIFPELCRRFGTQRMWRLVKQRAAKGGFNAESENAPDQSQELRQAQADVAHTGRVASTGSANQN